MNRCYLCGNSKLLLLEKLKEKPKGETDFGIEKEEYNRSIFICEICKVYNNFHNYDFSQLYSGNYNESTYQNDIYEKYLRIMQYPYDKSDNKKRVQRIIDFFKDKNKYIENFSILDIGSGLCVFAGELMQYGCYVDCLDPDPNSILHAINNVKVNNGLLGTLENIEINRKYDLITLNKVLEHVIEPAKMLSDATKLLKNEGIIYLELPDGDNALQNDIMANREEFFIEHFTVFNKESIAYLVGKAGLYILDVGFIHEPSDKYTIYVFGIKQK